MALMDSYKLKIAFCHPKYWLAWLGIFILFASSFLPYGVLLFIGKYLGRAAVLFAKKRGNIARRNLELCFPELSEKEIDIKVRVNFENKIGRAHV